MSRTSDKTKTGAPPKAMPAKAIEARQPKPKETWRDIVEQLVVAFILAVLIKGFVAEAFVIPTGSMAPTLYGQHKEVTCPYCHEVFGVNAADEAEERGGATIEAATCLNCRASIHGLAKDPSFKGDRILVMKFLYSLPPWLGGRKPSRWDVVVFHFPEDPETNYIKRLVGLPGEILQVYFGDLLSRPVDEQSPFRMLRKPLEHQQAMQQLVWDDTHRPKPFAKYPAWNRWRVNGESTEGESSSFRLKGAKDGQWGGVRYHNFVPDPTQWAAALSDADPGKPRASLVTDFYAYQSGVNAVHKYDSGSWFKPSWVGDLTVSGKVRASSGASPTGGSLRMELVEGGVVNVCEIELQTGQATISHGGKFLGSPVTTDLKADDREHDIMFANVDDRLTLWIDGKTPFGEGLTYDDGVEHHPAPTEADVSPAAITVKEADVQLSGLVLKRDIYYTQYPGPSDYERLKLTRDEESLLNWPADGADDRVSRILDILSDPGKFPLLGKLPSKEFAIQIGRYMMMGDNSPSSSDARAWTRTDVYGGTSKIRHEYVEKWAEPGDREAHEVPEAFLIGKAFFVYWPHGVPFWPSYPVSRDFRIPFRPYFERMRLIR